MIFADLKTNLKTGLGNGYIMSGSDAFLINKSVDLILQAANIEKLSVTRFDEDVKIDTINGTLQNVSMFGGGNAVIVSGVENTKVYLKPVKNDKELEKVDCKPMEEDLVVKLIMQNPKFNSSAAMTLARMCENNFSAINNEMEKLCAYFIDKDKIEVTDINEMVHKTEKYQIYELSNVILKRDITAIEKVLQSLIDNGVEEYAVFGSLLSFTRKLFYVKNSPLKDGDLSKSMEVHPYAVTSLRRDARHIDNLMAMDVYNYALDLEHQIKSGKVLTERAIMMLIRRMV